MKIRSVFVAVLTLAVTTPQAAMANEWLSATVSDMRFGCYGNAKAKKATGPCLLGDDRPGGHASNCELFSTREMRESCKLLQAEVHTPESCDATAANRTCETATACVSAREGVMNYYRSSGVANIDKALPFWKRDKVGNNKLILLATKIRAAMMNPQVVSGHKRALQAARDLKKTECP